MFKEAIKKQLFFRNLLKGDNRICISVVIPLQDSLRSRVGCRQRSGPSSWARLPSLFPYRMEQIPRTEDNKAKGWRLERGLLGAQVAFPPPWRRAWKK